MYINRNCLIGALILLIGFFSNVKGIHIVDPPGNIRFCEVYSDNDRCQQCKEGYRTSNDKRHCFLSGKSCDFEHCAYCQVTGDFTDLLCSDCSPKYMVTADPSTGGICLLPNPIPHCVVAEENRDLYGGAPFCYECAENYVLSIDQTVCFKLPQNNPKIDDCLDYGETDSGIVCNVCNTGYTLVLDSNCEKGCKVDNCDTCIQIPDSQGNPILNCAFCKKGFIGVFNITTGTYTRCLTRREWEEAFLIQFTTL